jgi:hypothetical protein
LGVEIDFYPQFTVTAPKRECKMEERRRYIRFDTSLDASCKSGEEEVSEFAAVIKNISREGLCLNGEQKISEGTVLDMALSVPGDNIPVLAQGQVAWSMECNGQEDQFDSGVKLVKMTGLDKSRLLEYVYNQWLRIKGFTKTTQG